MIIVWKVTKLFQLLKLFVSYHNQLRLCNSITAVSLQEFCGDIYYYGYLYYLVVTKYLEWYRQVSVQFFPQLSDGACVQAIVIVL